MLRLVGQKPLQNPLKDRGLKPRCIIKWIKNKAQPPGNGWQGVCNAKENKSDRIRQKYGFGVPQKDLEMCAEKLADIYLKKCSDTHED